jgi:hypothetical protein
MWICKDSFHPSWSCNAISLASPPPFSFPSPLSPLLPSNTPPFPLIHPVPHPLCNPTTHTADSIAKTQQPILTPRTLHIPLRHASNLYATFTKQPLHLKKTSPLILSPHPSSPSSSSSSASTSTFPTSSSTSTSSFVKPFNAVPQSQKKNVETGRMQSAELEVKEGV